MPVLIELFSFILIIIIVVFIINFVNKETKRDQEIAIARIKANAAAHFETEKERKLRILNERKAVLEKEKYNTQALIDVQKDINELENSMFGLDDTFEDTYVNRTEHVKMEKKKWSKKGSDTRRG